MSIFLWCSPALAQSGCDDLSAQPTTPAIDYPTQIQAIFDARCTGCHSGPGSAGLNLQAGQSHGNLVGVVSSQNAAWTRVTPNSLAASLLFHKVNCSSPPVGSRMPLGGQPLSQSDQALIRDWIEQGALPKLPPPETFRLGGTVSGLTGSGLVLQNNGGDDLAVAANGPFSFVGELEAGQAYSVTVLSQPSAPEQRCEISNGSGIMPDENIDTVEVDCRDGEIFNDRFEDVPR